MHVIIDGYNVIRQSATMQHLDALDLEAGRQALLARLAAYRSQVSHKITVVFDGWQGGARQETRDRRQGIALIYSRLGEPADEVIKRLLRQEGQRAVVVTSDREIQDCAQRAGATWINSPEFERDYLRPRQDSGEPEPGDEDLPRRQAKKGPARRLSKEQRQRRQRLKKL